MAKEPVVFYETDLVPQRKSHSLTRHRTSANRLAVFQKPGIYRELQQHWRSADPKQAKALERILTFFAVMLILTLVARGTAGATMATVTLASPGLGVITQSLRLDGAVRPAAQFRVECPADVPVAEILVNVGQNVQAGQPVVRLDAGAGERKLTEKNAERGQLRTQRSNLLAGTTVSASSIQSAQLALQYAQEDRDRVYANEEATDDEKRMADRSVEQAQLSLSQAVDSYNEAVQQGQRQQANNNASAAVLAAQIAELDAELETLTTLQQAGWTLTADGAGTVQSILCAVGQSTTGACMELTSVQDGYILEMPLADDQIQNLHTGQQVEISQGTAHATATITSVGNNEEQKPVALVKLGAPFTEGNASAVITLSNTQYQTCIPLEALRRDSDGTFVYTVESTQTLLGLQNVVVRQPVTVLESNDTTAALGGIGSEEIVTTSTKAITAGDKVRVGE